jgi:hypothetical protein
MIEFSEKDIKQLNGKGITKKKVEDQIRTFMNGIPFVHLEAPAVIKNGILKLSAKQENAYLDRFDNSIKELSLLKFVPASGAASRMFKSLFEFLDSYDPKKQTVADYAATAGDDTILHFFEKITRFPFYTDVLQLINLKDISLDKHKYLFVKELLSEEGLNYGFYPKGLLPFHKYKDHTATPFQEHLFEAAQYTRVQGKSNLHFTISENHQSLFDKEWKNIGLKSSKTTNTDFKLSYSYQKSSTDTIAVTLDNEPFRNDDGSLLFRPGGHGALIENLDEQDADIIFIKNIDNVVTQAKSLDNAVSKKVLAGVLLEVQEKVFLYTKMIDDNSLDGTQLEAIKTFLEEDLNVRFSDNYNGFTLGQQIEILKDKLQRPLRVCGMVRNEGEPGGGPYWIKDRNGNISLQIVESAQVDLNNEHQSKIFKEATHFNPVDIVCGVKDYTGLKYHLLNYIDEKQGFITQKTKEGKDLKALELPGLWNGAMAYWNTIFVEVPSATFNPVKTVNDLLKPAHQV